MEWKSRKNHGILIPVFFDRVYFYLPQSLLDHVTPAVTFFLKIENLKKVWKKSLLQFEVQTQKYKFLKTPISMLKIKAGFTFVQFSAIRKLAFFFLFSVTQKSARNPGNSLLAPISSTNLRHFWSTSSLVLLGVLLFLIAVFTFYSKDLLFLSSFIFKF